MILLLQLNGDMPDKFPGHERWLYIFGCKRKACRRKDGCIQGIRGIRRQKVKIEAQSKSTDSKSKPSVPSVDIGANLFGVSSSAAFPAARGNPFSTSSSSYSTSANPFAEVSTLAAKPPQKVDVSSLPQTFAEKAKIGEASNPPTAIRPLEPWPEESKFPPAYPFLHLDAEYETLSAPPTPEVSHTTSTVDTSDSGGRGEDKDLFESAMDKTFQKFADRIAQNPEQVLRYEHNGTPLLYSTTDTVGRLLASTIHKTVAKVTTSDIYGSRIPRCTNCGASRVFEVQLTPHAITALEEDEMSIDGMDWGTIILCVCSQDCGSQGVTDGEVGYVEEWTGVQWEELDERRK
jgi:pre-rRNA-processing protein TSR4